MIADYDLLTLCGRGAYGEVWVARSRSGQLVALKTLADAARMEKELAGLRSYSRLTDSPHLIRVLHTGKGPDGLYYTMELADNLGPDQEHYVPATLANILKRQGRLPPAELRRVGQAILSGLGELKQAGLVHRDLKPENILYVQGIPKLSDIGLVHAVSKTASLGGTLGFIPPERLRDGMDGNDHADDLYACGKVLYCCLTGNSVNDFPALPRELLADAECRALNRVVLTACDPQRRQRFHSTEEFSRALLLGLSPGKRLMRLAYRLRYVCVATLLLALLWAFAARNTQPQIKMGAIRQLEQLDVIAYGDGIQYLPEPDDALHEGILPYELDGAPRRKKLVFFDPHMAKEHWSLRDGTGFIFWQEALYAGSRGVARLQHVLPNAYALSFDIDCSGMNGAVVFQVAALDREELERAVYHWTLYLDRKGKLAVSPLAFRAEDGREYSFQPMRADFDNNRGKIHVDMIQTEHILRVYLNDHLLIYVPSLFFGGHFGVAADEKRSAGETPITTMQIHAIEQDANCPENEQYALPLRPVPAKKQNDDQPLMPLTYQRLSYLSKSFTSQAIAQLFAVSPEHVEDALEKYQLTAARIIPRSRTRQPRNVLGQRDLDELRRTLKAMPDEE